MSTVMETDPTTGMRALSEHVLLLAPSFGSWKGQYQLPKAKTTVQVDGVTVRKEDTSTPRSNLMTDTYPLDREGNSWKKRFNRIGSRLKQRVERYSVPFPIKGVRIVPRRRGDEFLKDAEQSSRELTEAADEFVNDLTWILEQIRNYTDAIVWRVVESKIPRDPTRMRAKFHVDVVPVQIAGLEDGNIDPTIVDAESLRTHSAIVRETIQRKVTEAIEMMVEGPREQLAKTLADLQGLINRDGRVNAGSFRPVRDAIAKIREFDFVANDELLTTIGNLERRLNITPPTELTSATAASSGFSAALETVVDEVRSSVRAAEDVARFGRELRGLDL